MNKIVGATGANREEEAEERHGAEKSGKRTRGRRLQNSQIPPPLLPAVTLLYCLLVFWPIVHADTVLIWAARRWAVAEGVLNKRNGGEEGMKKINSLSFKGSQPSEKKGGEKKNRWE